MSSLQSVTHESIMKGITICRLHGLDSFLWNALLYCNHMKSNIKSMEIHKADNHKPRSAWDETQTQWCFYLPEQQLALIIICSALLSFCPQHSEHVSLINSLTSQAIPLPFYLALSRRSLPSGACNQNSAGGYRSVAELFIIHTRPSPQRTFPSSSPQSSHPPFCSRSVPWIY